MCDTAELQIDSTSDLLACVSLIKSFGVQAGHVFPKNIEEARTIVEVMTTSPADVASHADFGALMAASLSRHSLSAPVTRLLCGDFGTNWPLDEVVSTLSSTERAATKLYLERLIAAAVNGPPGGIAELEGAYWYWATISDEGADPASVRWKRDALTLQYAMCAAFVMNPRGIADLDRLVASQCWRPGEEYPDADGNMLCASDVNVYAMNRDWRGWDPYTDELVFLPAILLAGLDWETEVAYNAVDLFITESALTARIASTAPRIHRGLIAAWLDMIIAWPGGPGAGQDTERVRYWIGHWQSAEGMT